MSGIGIEHFRQIGDLAFSGDRRLRIDVNQQGTREIVAPYRFAGFLVTRLEKYGATEVAKDELSQNTNAREAFYQALVKSYGQTIADAAVRMHTAADDVGLFRKSGFALTGLAVQQTIEHADKMVSGYTATNYRASVQYLQSGQFGSMARSYGHPLSNPESSELFDEFYRLVQREPSFNSAQLTKDQLDDIAGRAITNHCDRLKARCSETYPGLAQLGNGHIRDSSTYLEALRNDLTKPPLSNAPENFRLDVKSALEEIESCTRDLAKMSFDPGKALDLWCDLCLRLTSLQYYKEQFEKTDLANLDLPALELLDGLYQEIEHQADLVESKMTFLDEFRQNDPLSDKGVAYNKLIWAESSRAVVGQIYNELLDEGGKMSPSDRDKFRQLGRSLEDHAEEVRDEWEQAPTDRRSVPTKEDKFLGFIPNLFAEPHPFRVQQNNEKEWLRAKLIEHGLPSQNLTERYKKGRLQALDRIQEWKPVERTMVVSRDGVTRSYQSVITPGSKLEGPVGDSYRRDRLQGISAGNKTESGHARNLHISEFYRVDGKNGDDDAGPKRTLLSRVIRHGVLDSWKIGDPQERRQASEAAAREVVTTAANMDGDFKTRALEKAELEEQGEPQPRSRLVHVNINLTTADDSIRGKLSKDFDEGEFTKNQFESFEKLNGAQEIEIGGGKQVPIDVDTITFSFGVNEFAMQEGFLGAIVDPDTIWPPAIVEHNRQNLVKLVGDLQATTRPGGYIGEIVDQMRAKLGDPDTSDTDKAALRELIDDIQRQADLVRAMFNTGVYKQSAGDNYKMVRHLTTLTNLGEQALKAVGNHDMLMSISEGCKSGKDREGMGDVEHKTEVAIMDMGGVVDPGAEFSEQDQIIYNTMLTSSGQIEVQRYNTGLGGSKNATELSERIRDVDALRYGAGFSSTVEA